MQIEDVGFEGVKLITPDVFTDARGFFLETYQHSKYGKLIGHYEFPQDNLSKSCYGTIRGMHFQTTPGQAKLVQVIKGRVFDVFVDIRINSSTFGKWAGVYLDELTSKQLFLPIGFAHGFCCMSEDAIVLYKVSSEYNPATEKGFRYDDPDIGIKWPIDRPLLSQRDLSAPFLKDIDVVCCGL